MRATASKPQARQSLIALDFDGTLADTWPWFSAIVDEVADIHRFLKPSAGQRRELRHLDAHAILRTLDIPLWKAPRILADVRRRMQAESPAIDLFPGVQQAVAALAQSGAVMALVSSNAEVNVRRILGAETCACFHAFECGTDLFGKTAKLRRLLRRFDCDPAQSILVGDELRDVDAAHAAGMKAGSVAWGYNHPDALRAASPDVFFETAAALAGWRATG